MFNFFLSCLFIDLDCPRFFILLLKANVIKSMIDKMTQSYNDCMKIQAFLLLGSGMDFIWE